MVATVSPLNVLQNNSAPHQSSNASESNGGQSFASMLNTEMQHAAAPAQPVAPAQPANSSNTANPTANSNTTPASTPSTSNASNRGTTASASGTPSASGSAAQNGKKTGKTGQTQTDAQTSAAQAAAAATAATAAALAAAASNPDLKTSADANAAAAAASASSAIATSTNTATAASTATNPAASAAADQLSALAASEVPNTTSGKAGDISSKAQLNLLHAAATGKPTAAPVITQNAVTSASASSPGSFSKNSMQAPSELTAALNKNGNAESPPTQVAPEPVVPTTSTASAPALAAVTTPISATPVPMQKPAGQDLSIGQMNAIAPVLSMPANLEAATPTTDIAPQVGSPAWDQAVGQKINWMVNAGQQTASMTLNPPNLGPMQVVLSMNNQHVSATFISHQPEVREALESAIPKLREMMGQSGIQLGDCNVNSQSQQQAFAQQQSNKGSASSNSAINGLSNNIGVMPSESTIATKAGIGLVDTFV